jgi:hypothetical protein
MGSTPGNGQRHQVSRGETKFGWADVHLPAASGPAAAAASVAAVSALSPTPGALRPDVAPSPPPT